MKTFNDNLYINLIYTVDTFYNYKYVLQYRIDYKNGKIQDFISNNGENFSYINTYGLKNGSHTKLINIAQNKVLKFLNKTKENFGTIHINDINL